MLLMQDLAPSRDLPKSLNESVFFGDVIGELVGLLEDVVGLAEADGFVSTVGTRLGNNISRLYGEAGVGEPAQIADILCDLKKRIGGDFRVQSITDDQIILTNARCPFAERSVGKPSLCMMTTNVFGRVVADRNGYAHVCVDKSIAFGDSGCHVVVTLTPEIASDSTGYEFFNDALPAGPKP